MFPNTQKPLVNIFQGGYDGFGHQLEGTLRLLSLDINNKARYQFNYIKKYSFDHNNYSICNLINYISEALIFLSKTKDEIINRKNNNTNNVVSNEQRTFNEIIEQDINYEEKIYLYDGIGSGQFLPPNFESSKELEKSLPLLRKAFVLKNNYLPQKKNDESFINVCCHIRLGDALGTRCLDYKNIFNIIKHFQKEKNVYRIIIHSDGDVNDLSSENTILYDKKTDVLEILSDFIHADILIISYSALSIAAHLLADEKQVVICPDTAGITFKDRILSKCIKAVDFLYQNE